MPAGGDDRPGPRPHDRLSPAPGCHGLARRQGSIAFRRHRPRSSRPSRRRADHRRATRAHLRRVRVARGAGAAREEAGGVHGGPRRHRPAPRVLARAAPGALWLLHAPTRGLHREFDGHGGGSSLRNVPAAQPDDRADPAHDRVRGHLPDRILAGDARPVRRRRDQLGSPRRAGAHVGARGQATDRAHEVAARTAHGQPTGREAPQIDGARAPDRPAARGRHEAPEPRTRTARRWSPSRNPS